MSPSAYTVEAYCPVHDGVHVATGFGLKFPHGQVELEHGTERARLVPIMVCVPCRHRTAPEELERILKAVHAPAGELPPVKQIDWNKLR